MALQTANQFQLNTDFSRLGSGIQQGQQIANQFQAGQDRKAKLGQAQQATQLSGQALGGNSEALGGLAAIDPARANQIQTYLSSLSEADRNEDMRENNVMTKTALNALTLPEGERRNYLQQQRDVAANDGRSTDRIDGALAGDDASLNQALNFQAREGQTVESLYNAQFPNESKASEKSVTGTASQRDFNTYQELLTTDPKKAEIFGRQAGFIRANEQEKADIKVDTAIRKEVAKANTKRVQGYIDSGIGAADATGNIKRSLELLKTVKTGGFDNIALKAKQFFGVEGGDEAELSANLGKNVLAQLKPIFGSAFTEKEGQRLEVIEAGFGKSTAGNIRLLENALTIVDRAARRGLAAAEDQDDDFTANEIRDVLATIKAVKSEPETKKEGGVENTDANGNKAIVYPDGTFEEL